MKDTIHTIYDTMSNAAGATGIPLAFFKRAKKQGCPAFKNSRVYLIEFLRWAFTNWSTSGAIDWRAELTRAQAEREKLKLAKDRHELIPRIETHEHAVRFMNMTFHSLDRLFCNELPALAKGLDECGIRDVSLRAIEDLKKDMREHIAALNRENEASEEAKETNGTR